MSVKFLKVAITLQHGIAYNPRLETLNARLTGLTRFRRLLTLVDLKCVLDGSIVVDDSSNCFYHADRGIRLKNISSHVDADGAPFHGVVRKLKRFHLRGFLSASDDNRNRTALDQFFEVLAVVSLDDMRAELGRDAARQSQISHVARHIFPDGGYREYRNPIFFAFIDKLRQADKRFFFEFRTDKDRQRHRGNIQANTVVDRDCDIFVGQLLQDAGPAGNPQYNRFLRFGIDRSSQHAARQHNRIGMRYQRFDGLTRLLETAGGT